MLTFWAVTSVLVGILTWGQAQRKAEMILFRDVCGQIRPISILKGSKMLVNIIIIIFHPKSMDRDVSDDVIMTSSNRVHP